jgi:hypothetical protein
MKGSVEYKAPILILSGKWAMTPADSIWSDFSYRSTPVIKPATMDESTPPMEFQATGHFSLYVGPGSSKRVNESGLTIMIGGPLWPEAREADRPADSPSAPLVGVRGEGRNANGLFRLVGSYCPASGSIVMTKVYTGGPEEAKRASRDAAKRSRTSLPNQLLSDADSMGPRPQRDKKTAVGTRGRDESLKSLSTEMRKCHAITKRLMDTRSGATFSIPVDPEKHHCPNYFQIIAKPMDLGTVMDKLHEGEYASHEDWAADVALVFTNAMTYNPASHWVHQAAQALHSEFRSAYARMVSQLESQLREQEIRAQARAIHEAEQESRRKSKGGGSRRSRDDASATSGGSRRRSAGKRPVKRSRAYEGETDSDDDMYDLGLVSDEDDYDERPAKSARSKAKRPKSLPAPIVMDTSHLEHENAVLQKQLSSMQRQMQAMHTMMSTLFVQQAGSTTPTSMPPDFANLSTAPPPLAKTQSSTPRANGGASKPKKSDDAERPLTVAEQKQLKLDWESLTEEQEDAALNIIQQSMPLDESVSELDLKDIDTKTLRAVQRYINECLGRKATKRKPAKPAAKRTAADDDFLMAPVQPPAADGAALPPPPASDAAHIAVSCHQSCVCECCDAYVWLCRITPKRRCSRTVIGMSWMRTTPS